MNLNPFTSMNTPAPGTEVGFPVRSRPPGWLVEAVEFQSFPDAVYPWDPTIVKYCQKIDPRLRPLWVKLVFKRPVDDSRGWEWKVFGRHALGLKVDNPSTRDREKIPLLRGFRDGSPPNIVLEILEDNRPWMHEEEQGDLPGKYIKFDWFVLQGVRKLFVPYNVKADEPAKQALLDKREAVAKEKARLVKEFQDDLSEFKRTYVQPKLNQQSEVEAQKWLAANAAGQTGAKPKPYVVLGG
jgi:hypothetical protein